jgi:pSer/pThr/pTyr-binding forkhead associated (FHA) protein
MLVGPTPGVEYPLDRDRMSIGRAEDSTISVNHNSVSRLHCEVHALGDGRFEIVDKGSSNGVRVNAVELKRSIIEAGDVIELGDVRFKFVGAGQVFVPGPNESQQLTAISDREAELVDNSRRGWGGYVVPVLGAGVVGACMIIAFVYVLRGRAQADTPPIATTPTAAVDPEQVLVKDAKEKCAPDDCEASHVQINTLPATSQMRDHPDFKFIENTWARAILDRAKRGEGDREVRRTSLQRVERAQTVDATLRNEANKAIADLEEPGRNPSQLRDAQRDAGTTVTSALVPPPPATTPRPAPVHAPTSTTASTSEKPAPTASSPKPVQDLSGAAGKLLAEGNCSAVRSMLEKKVQNGTANTDELRQYNMAVHNANRPDRGCTH